MKILIYGIMLSVILMTGVFTELFSQNEALPKLTKFLILVETTDNGVKLTSQEGCAWVELSFTLTTDNTQVIDQFGMTSLKRDNPEKDSNFANFLFIIKKTKNGFSFEGIEGTAWKNLSFNCVKSKCHQNIDQFGMTDIK